MEEFGQLLHITAALSVPFMLGVVFGREWKREPAIRDHALVECVMEAADQMIFQRQFVGEEVRITRGIRFEFRGKPFKLTLEER